MGIKQNDLLLILIAIASIVSISLVSMSAALALSFGLILYFCFYMYRKLRNKLTEIEIKSSNDYKQVEALHSIFHVLDITYPLPEFRSWAISPDFAKNLIQTILKYKPDVIVETGSGISTIISAYCLKKLGKGKIISLEHLKEYADKTIENIRLHELSNFSEVKFSPLKEIIINNNKWLWYNAEISENIDLLIVDGPPATIQKNSRFPAIPKYFENLKENAIILLDDAIRDDEKEIVRQWKNEFNINGIEYVNLEKGAFILTKVKDRQ